MGADQSRSGGGHSGDDSDDEEWMQADKYAEWECADHMDYNGTAMTVRHVEMPLNKDGKDRITSKKPGETGGGSFLFSHEALVFDVMCVDGRVTKFTCELTFKGVLKRWGHHKVISMVKSHKNINVPMTEVIKRIQTPKGYDLISHNCKHYAVEKFKMF